MKKLVFIFLFIPVFAFAQEYINLKNNILDSIKFFPIGDANIYNFDFKSYIFTTKAVKFDFLEKKKDTIEHNLPETYAEFKRDFFNTNFTHSSKKPFETNLTKQDIVNAKFSSGDLTTNNVSNLLKEAGKLHPVLNEISQAVTSPISYLYDKYSRKKKMERLYQDLVNNQEEVYNLSQKYNQDLVASITGLEGEELLNFMTYCKFSYYDLIHWSPEYIVLQIKKRFGDYEYFRALEEDY